MYGQCLRQDSSVLEIRESGLSGGWVESGVEELGVSVFKVCVLNVPRWVPFRN